MPRIICIYIKKYVFALKYTANNYNILNKNCIFAKKKQFND